MTFDEWPGSTCRSILTVHLPRLKAWSQVPSKKSFCPCGSILLFPAEAENAANRLRNHAFFVRANNANHHLAGRCGNHSFIRCVFLFVDVDSKEFQSFANPGADRGRVLSDPPSKHQCVQ